MKYCISLNKAYFNYEIIPYNNLIDLTYMLPDIM